VKLIVWNFLEKCECKKITPVHPVKTYRKRRGIAPFILNLCNGWSELSAIRAGRFTPRKVTLGTKAGLNVSESSEFSYPSL
jgi:hypothetical protein